MTLSRPASVAERCTRGPFGIEPLYFDRHTLATGTSLHDLWCGQAPDLESLTEYLAFGEIWRDEATFLEGIGRVPPGASLAGGHIARSVRSSSPPLTTAAGHALVERCWSTLGSRVVGYEPDRPL